MQVIKNDMTAYVDVDQTLVLWGYTSEDPGAIQIQSPDGLVSEYVIPHLPHIEKVKHHKARGQLVVVWSAGGWEWAEAVVRKLGLENYVDLVIAKPQWAWDDLTPNEFIRERCYIDYKPSQSLLRNT